MSVNHNASINTKQVRKLIDTFRYFNVCGWKTFRDQQAMSQYHQDIKSSVTHILDFLVSTVVRDLFAQVHQHMISGIICLTQQQVNLLSPFLIPKLFIL